MASTRLQALNLHYNTTLLLFNSWKKKHLTMKKEDLTLAYKPALVERRLIFFFACVWWWWWWSRMKYAVVVPRSQPDDALDLHPSLSSLMTHHAPDGEPQTEIPQWSSSSDDSSSWSTHVIRPCDSPSSLMTPQTEIPRASSSSPMKIKTYF